MGISTVWIKLLVAQAKELAFLLFLLPRSLSITGPPSKADLEEEEEREKGKK